jgi:hypothetical protein
MTLQEFASRYNQPEGRDWSPSEWANITSAYNASNPTTSIAAMASPAANSSAVSPQDVNEFKNFINLYDKPAGRDWYSHEISNIAQAFATSKGKGGDANYVGSLAGTAAPGKVYQQAPADLFAEGQDNGDSLFDGPGGLLALAALAAGGYGLMGGLSGGAGLGGSIAGEFAGAGALGGGAAAGGAGGAGWLGSVFGNVAPTVGAEFAGAVGGGLGSAGAGGAGAVLDGAFTGSGGGNMDWLDEILNLNSGDLPAYQGNPLAGLGGNSGVNISGLDWDVPPSGVNTNVAPTGSAQQVMMQKAVDAGLPFDLVSKMNVSQLTNLTKLLPGGGGTAAGGTRPNALTGLSNMLGIDANTLALGGALGGGVLDYLGGQKQLEAAQAADARNWNAGAPSRARYEAGMTPGFDLNSIPGYAGALSTGMDAFNRSLSAKDGNPWGQGGAAGEAISWAGKNIALPAWQTYTNQNANAGGIGALSGASANSGMSTAGLAGNGFTSLGKTAGQVFNPQTSLSSLLQQYGGLA